MSRWGLMPLPRRPLGRPGGLPAERRICVAQLSGLLCGRGGEVHRTLPKRVERGATKVRPSENHFKELVNKIAWALGSTYSEPYDNPRSGARLDAIEIVVDYLKTH